MTETIENIKEFIREDLLIERLEVEVDEPEELSDDALLFDVEGIGLDSVEALQISSAIEQKYGVTFFDLPEEELRTHFQSIGSLANYVFSAAVKAA